MLNAVSARLVSARLVSLARRARRARPAGRRPAGAALAAALVLASLAPVLSSTSALAQDAAAPRPPVISVVGEGEVAVAPDVAILSLTVLRQAKTAAAAVSANSSAMAEVLAALKADGVAERDLQTSSFSIYPRYRQNDKGSSTDPQEIVGYDVSNSLSVKVRDLSKLGGLVDASVRLGVNQGGQIVFTNDSPKASIETARKAAVADALSKARTLAEAAGVKLGKLMELSEENRGPAPAPMMRMAMAKDAAPAPVPVAAGENTYTVNVNATFGIDQ